MGGVRAKIGLTGQLDRRQPGNYFKPCPLVAEVVFPTVDQVKVMFTFLKDVIRVPDQVDHDQQRAYHFFLQYLEQRCESEETEGELLFS